MLLREPLYLLKSPPHNSRNNAAPAAQDSFVRIEEKFILNRSKFDSFLELVHQKMSPSYFHNDTQFNVIESIYFDSSDLHVYRSHFLSPDFRFKLRARKYFRNGQNENGPVFVECKTKDHGVCKKSRFAVSNMDFQNMMDGSPLELTENLIELNRSIPFEKLLKRIVRTESLMGQYRLKPKMRITYKRLAFENSDLRLTIDDQIQFSPMAKLPLISQQTFKQSADTMALRYMGEKTLIVEAKHHGVMPQWLQDFAQSNGLNRASFSKYCAGISRSLLNSENNREKLL